MRRNEIEPRDELSPIAYADALKKAAQKSGGASMYKPVREDGRRKK